MVVDEVVDGVRRSARDLLDRGGDAGRLAAVVVRGVVEQPLRLPDGYARLLQPAEESLRRHLLEDNLVPRRPVEGRGDLGV